MDMKRVIIFILLTNAIITITFAQDIIFLTSNDSIVAKVLTVNKKEVTYQKWSNLQGPTYSLPTEEIIGIKYNNGSYDSFGYNSKENQAVTTTNKYLPVYRNGNTYYYGDLIMDKYKMLSWLEKQNCQMAYSQFSNGYKLAQSGWILLGIGFLCDIPAAILVVRRSTTQIGYLLGAIGGAFEIACIPTLSVGYARMHHAVDTYNSYNYNRNYSYWAIQCSSNGIGIAYHF